MESVNAYQECILALGFASLVTQWLAVSIAILLAALYAIPFLDFCSTAALVPAIMDFLLTQ